MAKLGTILWSEQTQGTLGSVDKLKMLTQEVQRQITSQWRRYTRRQNMQVDRVDLDKIVIPDSQIASASLGLIESVAPKSLLYHSLRTYYWGSILAMQNDLSLDAEVFYIMSMLHDIGLCDACNQADGKSQCFAVEGGRVAGQFMRDNEQPDNASYVQEAIVMHLNLHVPVSEGVEKHLLPAATSLDVVGARIGELKRDTVQAVIERYPRLSFKDDLIAMFNREYTHRPNSRIAFMQQVGNLNRLIKNAPFES